MEEKLNAEDKKEIVRILSIKREPQTINVPIIENISRGITQFKVVIPKKFATSINLSKAKHQIQFQLTPPNTPNQKGAYELVAKVIPK